MADVIHISRGPRSATHATLGMSLFLGSWGVTFVGLFVAYAWVRLRQPAWPPAGAPPLPVTLPIVNSVVVLVSSVSAQLVLVGVRDARRGLARAAILVTLVLGATFLALQTVQWTHLWHEGLRLYRRGEGQPWNQGVAYAGCFYALTWFHAAHVVCGLLVLGWLAPGVLRWIYTPGDHLPVRFAIWFWHFVTVAWAGVYLALYVI